MGGNARNEQLVTDSVNQIDRDDLKAVVGSPQMLASDEAAVAAELTFAGIQRMSISSTNRIARLVRKRRMSLRLKKASCASSSGFHTATPRPECGRAKS